MGVRDWSDITKKHEEEIDRRPWKRFLVVPRWPL